MSLTSYRAAPPRGLFFVLEREEREQSALSGSGGDLLSRGFCPSTIGAVGLNFRVRDGIGCLPHAMSTGPAQCTHFSASNMSDWEFEIYSASSGSYQAYRAISTGLLNALLRLHIQPIDVVVFHGSRRDLVLRGASRLDAFSGYPVRT